MKPETVAVRREGTEKIANAPDAALTTDAPSAPWLEPYRWRPGETGNRGGRLGKLAQRVRQATRDGQDLVTFLVDVMNDAGERTRDRLHAAEMLLSRGWGKAVLPVALKALVAEHHSVHVDAQILAGLEPHTARTFLDVLSRLIDAQSSDSPKGLPAPEKG